MRRSGHRVLGRAAALLVLATGMLALTAVPAAAHPLGNFTVNRYTGILVAPAQVTLDHVIDLAEIPTAQLGPRVDDLPQLADDQCATASEDLRVEVASQEVSLTLVEAAARTSPGEGGLPVTRISCRFEADATISDDATEVRVTDDSSSAQVGWREMVAVGDGATLDSSDVPDTSSSARLSSYPEDLLASPPEVTSAELSVSPGGPAGALPGEEEAQSEAGGSWLETRATELLDQNGLLTGALALLLALLLGASHALAPGHGKTVMAFYLTQREDASWRSAVAVGTTVTVAHTGSVLALGLLVSLSASFVPARLYPWLTLATGVLILALGASLLRAALRNKGTGHGHGHGHGHGPGHGHGHGHGHGQGAATLTATAQETEETTVASRPGRFGLWTMGLVGGLVPSPSALLLLLAAVAVGRAWFGILIVIAFGVGMATSLAVVGLLARDLIGRVERLVTRRGILNAPVRSLLAYGAATGVCLIGAGVILRTVITLV